MTGSLPRSRISGGQEGRDADPRFFPGAHQYLTGMFLLYPSPAYLFWALLLLCHFTFPRVSHAQTWLSGSPSYRARAELWSHRSSAVERCTASWQPLQGAAPTQPGLVATTACFKVQFLPSTRAQGLGSLSRTSNQRREDTDYTLPLVTAESRVVIPTA